MGISEAIFGSVCAICFILVLMAMLYFDYKKFSLKEKNKNINHSFYPIVGKTTMVKVKKNKEENNV